MTQKFEEVTLFFLMLPKKPWTMRRSVLLLRFVPGSLKQTLSNNVKKSGLFRQIFGPSQNI